MEKLAPHEREFIASLRLRGFAVTIFGPDELGTCKPADVEEDMMQAGANTIGFAYSEEE